MFPGATSCGGGVVYPLGEVAAKQHIVGPCHRQPFSRELYPSCAAGSHVGEGVYKAFHASRKRAGGGKR